MAGSPHADDPAGGASDERRMPSFWLPPHSRGNGLDAEHWAEIVVVPEDEVGMLLAAFRAAGVPARAAPQPRGRGRLARVFVAPERYAQAENTLLHLQLNPGGGTSS
jgi:hypothetical protein